MRLVGSLVFLGLLGVFVWLVLRPRYVFVIAIVQGAPRVTRGKVTAAFLAQVRATCSEFGVQQGWLGGVRRGQRTRLVCSRHLPPPCQQRLRNLWTAHG